MNLRQQKIVQMRVLLDHQSCGNGKKHSSIKARQKICDDYRPILFFLFNLKLQLPVHMCLFNK